MAIIVTRHSLTQMLSIAIKNSMILALVILIAHFLLKSSTEEAQAQAQAHDHDHAQSRANVQVQVQALAQVPNTFVNAIPSDSGDDLYSYVYGPASLSQTQTTQTQTQTQANLQAQVAPLDQGCGSLMAYEGGVSDHWSMV